MGSGLILLKEAQSSSSSSLPTIQYPILYSTNTNDIQCHRPQYVADILITKSLLTQSILPATAKVITPVSGATAPDIDLAVDAAEKAYKTSWGLKVPGAERGRLLSKLADLLEKHSDELSALEALNVGAFTSFTLNWGAS